MEHLIRIACVGDSITSGAGTSNPGRESYPAQLAALFSEKRNVKNFGVPGTTALKKGSLSFIKSWALRFARHFKPDIVIINFGVNDTKKRNWFYKKNFVKNYVELINGFRDIPSHPKIFICYPTPVFPNPYGISQTIMKDELIPLIDTVIKQTNTKLIDLNTALSDKKELFPDGIHPNAQGYTIIARTIFDAINS